MKKLNTRSYLFILLAVVSLASYMFLNNASSCTSPCNKVCLKFTEPEEDTTIYAPDITLINHIIDAGANFLNKVAG